MIKKDSISEQGRSETSIVLPGCAASAVCAHRSLALCSCVRWRGLRKVIARTSSPADAGVGFKAKIRIGLARLSKPRSTLTRRHVIARLVTCWSACIAHFPRSAIRMAFLPKPARDCERIDVRQMRDGSWCQNSASDIYIDGLYIISNDLSSPSESSIFRSMLFAEQVRAARSLLAWKQEDLARSSGLGIATIQRIERKKKGVAAGNVSTIVRIQEAFERAGIQFIEADGSGGIGLRLVQPKAKKQKSSTR